MIRILKGMLFLVPSVVACIGLIWYALYDCTFRRILRIEIYSIGVIISLVVLLVTAVLLWQWAKTGIYLIFGIDLRMKKNTEQDA